MSPSDAAVLSAASAEALELPRLLRVVALFASTDLGRERVLALAPAASAAELAGRSARYEEWRRLAGSGRLVASAEAPYGAVLDVLADGRPVGGPELVHLAGLLETTEGALERIAESREELPAFARRVERLPRAKTLLTRVRRTLDRRGEVRDDATPELARLRREIQRRRDGVYSEMQRLIQRHRDLLTEETIPLRGGRLVLMLQSGARGRLKGLVHGRSATGRSFYFEPLTVVEQNNRLQQALEEESAEKARVLAELVTAVMEDVGLVLSHAELLAELDLIQSEHDFAAAAGGRTAELAPDGELRLVEARHPLLDPRLAALRERALGVTGHAGEIVPLDAELGGDERILVVTGPNAGGKTVALKTVGLLAAAAQCGLPVPAAKGTRLPLLKRLVAVVGDEQDLLADRSTFSGRLLRLREAWDAAGPTSLVLLDELGSGTDPEEGSALARALLEGLLAGGCLALLTTHLVQVALAALEAEGAGCAAMDVEPETMRPTYRILPGPPGGSEALALARRLGLPAEWIARAETLLGSEHKDLRTTLIEMEKIRRDLGREQDRVVEEKRSLARARGETEAAREELEQELAEVATKTKRDLVRFQRKVRRRLEESEARLRDELEAGRRRGLVGSELERVLEGAPETAEPDSEPGGELAVGGPVRHRALGWEGVLEALSGSRAVVSVRGKRLRCQVSDLVTRVGQQKPASRPKRGQWKPRESQGIDEHEAAAVSELNLIGQRVEPALIELERFLDRATLDSLDSVRVIHGHGTGRLRAAVREALRRHPNVATVRPGKREEGGDGATVVALR